MAKGKGGPTLPVLSKTERENLDKQVREEQSYLKGNQAGAPVKSEAELPAGARVVCFHGRPRPTEINPPDDQTDQTTQPSY